MAVSTGIAPAFSALTGRHLHDFDLETLAGREYIAAPRQVAGRSTTPRHYSPDSYPLTTDFSFPSLGASARSHVQWLDMNSGWHGAGESDSSYWVLETLLRSSAPHKGANAVAIRADEVALSNFGQHL